jgi:hypothetical protein
MLGKDSKQVEALKAQVAALQDEIDALDEAAEQDLHSSREKIVLGEWYRDVIHDFVGVAIAYQWHITGCDRVFIEFKNSQGTLASRDADLTTYVPAEPPEGCAVRQHTPLDESNVILGATYRCNVTGVEGVACTISERIGFDDYNIRLDHRNERDEVQYEHVWERDLTLLEMPSEGIETMEEQKKEEKPGHCGSSMISMM